MKCKPNLTFPQKYAILQSMKNVHKSYYKNHTPVCPATFLDWNRHKILEIQKARCREKMGFHKRNVITQSIISLMCLSAGVYAGYKRSILVPLVLAPMASASCSTLAKHETKRQRYKEILNGLERN